ncbi:MAG: VWA domain-containing protein [Dehalococcoidales bacterium]|nr:VWA domain-containing protein [Dehalococcoidales bacterium]
MGISFANPWVLLLLVPVFCRLLFYWRRSLHNTQDMRSRTIAALRLLLMMVLVLAVAAPFVRYEVDRQAVIFVADLSASMDDNREQVESFVRQAMDERNHDDAVGIVAAGRGSLVEWPVSDREGFEHFLSAIDPDHTNLADGLRLAGALFPEDARKRIVLLSDGQQNLGDAVEQARFLQSQGVQVDVVPLERTAGSEVLVASVNVPSSARTGEKVPVEVEIRSTQAAPAVLRMYLDGAMVASRDVVLETGQKRFAFDVAMEQAGFHTLRATIDSESDTLYQNNRADAFVNVQGPPTVLIVEDRQDAGKNVAEALRATGLHVEVRSTAIFPDSLEDLGQYSGIVLVDVPADALGQKKMEIVRAAVRDLGKGLLVIGGNHSLTMGGYGDTPLEEVLPVTSEVPERQEKGKVALVLVVDKSGSMSGAGSDGVAKVEMAKEAARLSLEEPETYDLAGVVAFDAANWWLVPLEEIGNETNLEAMQKSIGTLVADGGTDIYPALVTACQSLADAPTPRKHIVLLTDGNSQQSDYSGLLATMQEQEITLSTIAVGLDADTNLLQWLADYGEGRYYFTDRARDIPQILTKETRLASRNAIVEEPTMPLVAGSSPVLQVMGGEFPSLGGYVMTLPRNTARVVLVSPRGDPLLAQWQYGLGRSIAWTSDSEGRWTTALTDWERAPVFWSALVDWTLPPEEAPFQVKSEVEAGKATVQVEGEAYEGSSLSMRIVGPKLDVIEVPLRATSPDRWEAEFPTNEQGSYLVQVTEETPEGGYRTTTSGMIVPYSPEFRDMEADQGLLERLAAITGGGVLTDPSESFATGLPPAYGAMPLAWWLLMAAAFVLPLDIAFRRLNVRPTEALALLAAARDAVLRRGRRRQAVPAMPVLGNIRRRRVQRVRVRVADDATESSRETAAYSRNAHKEAEKKMGMTGEEPASDKGQTETLEPSTERWLRAKRRARKK